MDPFRYYRYRPGDPIAPVHSYKFIYKPKGEDYIFLSGLNHDPNLLIASQYLHHHLEQMPISEFYRSWQGVFLSLSRFVLNYIRSEKKSLTLPQITSGSPIFTLRPIADWPEYPDTLLVGDYFPYKLYSTDIIPTLFLALAANTVTQSPSDRLSKFKEAQVRVNPIGNGRFRASMTLNTRIPQQPLILWPYQQQGEV